LPASSRTRILLALTAVLLLVAGIVTWRLVDLRAQPSTTIPASFDGNWVGQGAAGTHPSAGFETQLVQGLNIAQLRSLNSACYSGSLTVTEATDAKLTMRLAPQGADCSPWTVVFTHSPTSDGQLVMSVDPDNTVSRESEFQIPLRRKG